MWGFFFGLLRQSPWDDDLKLLLVPFSDVLFIFVAQTQVEFGNNLLYFLHEASVTVWQTCGSFSRFCHRRKGFPFIPMGIKYLPC